LPSAIFACNDITAFGVIEAIKEAGLHVPGDVSVIGFDNIAQCEYLTPKLTSVDVDVNTIAKAALQQLLSIIETQTDLNLKIVIPTKLVLRNSVKNIF
jgi:DNA-binding LacI/PurR family transcriptional regulator